MISTGPAERHVDIIRAGSSFHGDVHALSAIVRGAAEPTLFGRRRKPLTQELSLAVPTRAAVARPPC